MKRGEVLGAAAQCVNVSRESQYGSAQENFTRIAALWSAYLGDADISAHDAAMMLALLKVARARANPQHMDSVIDGCGYLALAGELADGL